MSAFNPMDPTIDGRGWYRAATERRELLAMDDRMLRDMGINRLDVQRIVRGCPMPARAEPPRSAGPGTISPRQRDACIARAHRLRNEAIRDAFRALLRWLKPQPIARMRKLAPVAR